MEPARKKAKLAEKEEADDAIEFVKANRGRALTKEERLDILVVSANLRSKAARLHTKEPIDVKVARLLSRSNRTVQQTWSTFVREGIVLVAEPPANRNQKPTRTLSTVDLLSSVRTFIQTRCATRTRTVAKDVLSHLTQSGLMLVDHDDEGAMASALRAVQRFVKRAGFRRGKAKGSYRMSDDHIQKRNEYVRKMLAADAHEYRDVYMDESYVHLNYASHDDSLYDPESPNLPKAKHKGERLCFIAAIVDKDRSQEEAADDVDADSDTITDDAVETINTNEAFLLAETIDIFQGGKQTKDYHGMFDHPYFTKWMDVLIAALAAHGLKKCRIIMDNAKYHKVLPESVPRKKEKKAVLAEACKAFGIPVLDGDNKSDLWTKLDAYVTANVRPVIVEKAKAAGHEVVFTPPCFSDLQPIETVWAIVKGEVGRQYTAETKFAEIRPRLARALHGVRPKTVQGCIDKARRRLRELKDHIEAMDDVRESDSDDSHSESSDDSDETTDIVN